MPPPYFWYFLNKCIFSLHVFLQIYHLPSPLCGKHINTFSRCESWALLTHFQFFTKKFSTKKTHIEHCWKYDLCMMRTLVLLFQWNTAIVLILKADWSRQCSYTQRDKVWLRKWRKKSSWISDLSQISNLPILVPHSVEGKYAKHINTFVATCQHWSPVR